MMAVWVILMFVTLMVLLLLGYPVAFTLGAVALAFGSLFLEFNDFLALPHRIWGIMTNFTLVAVPLFVFMGMVFDRSGLAEDLLEAMGKLCGKLKGNINCFPKTKCFEYRQSLVMVHANKHIRLLTLFQSECRVSR